MATFYPIPCRLKGRFVDLRGRIKTIDGAREREAYTIVHRSTAHDFIGPFELAEQTASVFLPSLNQKITSVLIDGDIEYCARSI
ncbi:MAG: hypothetical protein AAF449_13780 [Myxococcota bacterium]